MIRCYTSAQSDSPNYVEPMPKCSFNLEVLMSRSKIMRNICYCWWKKSCTTWDIKPGNNGIFYQPQLLQDFFQRNQFSEAYWTLTIETWSIWWVTLLKVSGKKAKTNWNKWVKLILVVTIACWEGSWLVKLHPPNVPLFRNNCLIAGLKGKPMVFMSRDHKDIFLGVRYLTWRTSKDL